MDGGAPLSAGKGQKPRQNSLKKQNSGSGGYSRNSAPVYSQQQRRGPMGGNYDFKSPFRNDDRGAVPVVPEGLWANHGLVSLLCNLIGCEVRFRLKDGREYEGIFEAFSPKGEFAFSLCCQLNKSVPDRSKVDSQTIVEFKDVASLSAKAVNIINLRTDFETDIGISQRLAHGPDDKVRQLEAWEPDADDGAMMELEDNAPESNSNNGGWSADDMFRKNKPLQDKETKAGILKTSRHGDYDGKTVDVFSNVTADESEVTDEIREIAANIERTSASTVERLRQEKDDTEENFSAVMGNRATWQPNQGQGGRGGGNQRGAGANRGRGGGGRGVPNYAARKSDGRLPGLPPTQMNQSPYQGQQSPQPGVGPSNFNRMPPNQQPVQSTPPPGALAQRGFSPKPSPPPLVSASTGNFIAPSSTPPQQPPYTAPTSYASAVEPQESQQAPNNTTTNGAPSYSSAAAQNSGASHYVQQPKTGSWRQAPNPQAVEQQKRDIVHAHQIQVDTMDRAALVQDLKQTTASISVTSPQSKQETTVENTTSNVPPVTSPTPTPPQPSRQTVTVKAGGGSHQTATTTVPAASAAIYHPPDSSAGPSSGRESMDSLNVESTGPSQQSMESSAATSTADEPAAIARTTPVVPMSTTPHPLVSSDQHSTPSSMATPSAAATTPSTSASAMSNFLKKLNPLAEEFVPRGPASLASPAPSTSVSAIQSPTAVSSIASNVVSPAIANIPVVPPVPLLTAAAAALPPPSLLPPNVGAPPPPAVLSVINQQPTVVPQLVQPPQPQTHPQPGIQHHAAQSQAQQQQQPQHHPQPHHQGSGVNHHRPGRNSQQFNNHNQQRQTAEFVPGSAAQPQHDSQAATAAAFALAHQQAAVVTAPQTAWTTIVAPQTPQGSGAPQIASSPYYQVAAAHQNATAAAAVNAARFVTPNSTGTPHQVTVAAQFPRPATVVGGQPSSVGTQGSTQIMYTPQGAQQAQVGKPGASEFTPTFSIVTPSGVMSTPGQSYAVLQSANHTGQSATGHPTATVAFYQTPQQGQASQVMTLHQAASMQQSQHAVQQQTPQQTAQAVAQQLHQQQLQAQAQAQHQQAQQQQQHLAQQLQQASLNGQTAQLVQQAIAAQQYQQQVAAAQAQQQQAHQNQQQQMLSAQQQTSQAVAAQNAAAMVSAQQHGQFAPQTLLYYYPATAGQAAGTHPALLQSAAAAGAQSQQAAQMIPAQFYPDPRYAMPVVAQQTAQQGASHSNVATPAQTPTGSGPPFLFMAAPGGHGMQNIAYYHPNLQLVTQTAQVQPGQPATQPSGP